MSRSVSLKVRVQQKIAFLEDQQLEQFDISDWPLICQHCTATVLKAVVKLEVNDISLIHKIKSTLFGQHFLQSSNTSSLLYFSLR